MPYLFNLFRSLTFQDIHPATMLTSVYSAPVCPTLELWSPFGCLFGTQPNIYLIHLRPCSHLFRFAFRSRSSPVPLVRVAFTPGKIDWNGSGFGPVTRSHLFRNATGTGSPVNTPPPPKQTRFLGQMSK